MQERRKTEAIILRHYPVGENHRNAHFFTAAGEIFSATIYGARSRKSRLGPLVFPFHRVEVTAVHDRVRDRWRVDDIQSLDSFEGVRAEVERYYTASLWAEILMKSPGAGSELYPVLRASLQRLKTTPPRDVFPVSAAFMWRYLEEEGVAPENPGPVDMPRPQVRALLYRLVQSHLEQPLKIIKSGMV